MPEEEKAKEITTTWESLAISLAKYFVETTGKKIIVTPELVKELKAKGYYYQLSEFIR